MNCNSVREILPLYLSGELDEPGRAAFTVHIERCGSCRADVKVGRDIDARLRSAVFDAPVETAHLEAALHGLSLPARQPPMKLALAVAAILCAVGYGLWRHPFAPQLYLDAARDHRTEIMERQSRKWRSTANEVDSLTAGFGFSQPRAAALAPAGYRLSRARRCRLAGRAVLHLVYTNGVREYSVYVRQRDSGEAIPSRWGTGEESIASVGSSTFLAVVVVEGSPEDCDRLARFAAKAL